MNPALILILILALGPAGGKHKAPLPHIRPPRLPKGPAYIDTFKMEMTLDRLQNMTNAIEKINHLNQVQRVPERKGKLPTIDRVQESLEAVQGFLADGKPSRQVDTISNTLSGVKNLGNLGNLDEMMSAMGPVLAMMKNAENK